MEQTSSIVRFLMRPIARFLVSRAVPFQTLVEMAKVAYVEAAVDDMKRKSERRINASRLSVATGLQRKDVTRILQGEVKDFYQEASTIAKVISQWENDRTFLTKSGRPRVLSFGSDESDFSELVFRVSTDVKPGAVLTELLRLGAVQKTKTGIKLDAKVNTFPGDAVSKYQLLSEEINTLLLLAEDNIPHDENKPHHHTRTAYDNVFVDSLPQVKRWLDKEGRKFHKRVRAFLSKHDNDLNHDPEREAGGRVFFSTFGYIPQGDDESQEKSSS